MSDTTNANFQQSMARLMRRLKGDVRQRVISAAARGLKHAAERVKRTAMGYAPVGGGIYSPKDPEPGRMRDSAMVSEPEITPTYIRTTVSFNTVYAARQHEDLTLRHSQGQAKYLETAMQTNWDVVPMMVRDAIHQELKSG